MDKFEDHAWPLANMNRAATGNLGIMTALDQAPLMVAPDTPLLTVLRWMMHGPPNAATPEIPQSPDTTVAAARSSYVLVNQHKKLMGIMTERDVVRLTAQGDDLSNVTVADVMTRQLITLREEELADGLSVLEMFHRHRIRHLPIVQRDGSVVGVATPQSMRQTMRPSVLFKLRQVSDVMSDQVVTSPPDATVLSLAQLMAAHRVSCVVIAVAGETGRTNNPVQKPVGIVTEWDIVQFQSLGLDFQTVTVGTVMSAPLVFVQPETSLWEVNGIMERLRLRRLVVTNAHGSLGGIVTQTSLLAILNPLEIGQTIEVLEEQVEQLQDHRMELLEHLNHSLSEQVVNGEKRFQFTFDQAAAGIALIDVNGNFLQVNRRFCQIFGYSEPELLAKTALDLTHPDHLAETQHGISQLLQGQVVSFTYDKRCFCRDGSLVWLHVTISRVQMPTITYLVIVAEDVSERKQLEQELEQHRHHLEDLVRLRTVELRREIDQRQAVELALCQEKDLAQITLQSIGDAVVTTDASGLVTSLNPVAEELMGWPMVEAVGRPLSSIFVVVNAMTREPVENPVDRVLREGCMTGLLDNTTLLSRDGTEYGIDDSAAPICDRNGKLLGTVMVFRDVTQARNIAQQLSWQAGHDSLTGLANRCRFEKILTTTLMDFSRHNHVLCYLDLDRFKIVNDTCGHTAGDELLRQVAMLLKKQVRHVDTLARLGGDEFGLILYGCPIPDAVVIVEKIRTVIQELQFVWEENTFQIGISIGLVRLNATMLDSVSAVSAADAACYQAKAKGRNRIQVYEADDVDILQQRGQQQWSLRIKQALAQDRFCLFSQPIRPTQAATNKQHYEILLRMVDESGELIAPGQFIPAAERYDLMVAIDRWVVTHCLEYLAQPTTMAAGAMHMINLSGVSLGDEEFLSFLTEQLATIPFSPQSICFEITETAAVRNINQAIDFMRQLKQLGLSFALDDFGTGMSSFAYLKSLPIDYVKIDGKFISDMAVDNTAIAIVEAIHNVVRVMGLQTIAEFVETPAICDLVQQIGIDFMQGYHIAKPSPLLLIP